MVLKMQSNFIYKNKSYIYDSMDLQSRSVLINRDDAFNGCEFLFDLFEKNSVRAGLIYGSLLGGVRESNFILHDKDVDIYVMSETIDAFIGQFTALEKYGFRLVRVDRSLFSFIFKDTQFDFYVFRPYLFFWRICNRMVVKKQHFIDFSNVTIHSRKFPCLSNPIKFLKDTYGPSWATPLKDLHASENLLIVKIKKLIKSIIIH
jgi:lipopolysaccharide cholinephosphotransferase